MHVDGQYGHQPGEMNFLCALTDVYASNGLYYESEPAAGDFREVTMGAGRLFAFAGVSRRHYNKRNATDHARVSFDFRIAPMSRFDEAWQHKSTGEGHHTDRFTLDKYFELVRV